MKQEKAKPKAGKKMSMAQFEGSKADKIADAKALKKINAKRSGRG